MINPSRRKIFQLSQTKLLITGLLISYLGFIFWLGMRLIVIFSGAVIVVLAIASWYMQLQRQKSRTLANSADLLQLDVFLGHINYLDNQIPHACQSLWRSVRQQTLTIQQITIQISQQESTFTPDLLETLHTVLDLLDRLIKALQVTEKVQTSHYRELAKQQLQSSLTRLQHTQDQLQELHDQIALDNLGQPTLTNSGVISTRLQTLIVENTRGILGD
ncbi:hypothetical protein [Anabaena sp. UHCC 0399]|uniref:hypothetical protein n=1 Tax=Anabaena sp. UHCC 0399 TaxID=3110238 RepID=UPI002B1EB0EA|nr:hypothetical protein [Anabaena sp. UHCC 0399]MEA5568128.1 hypothetical protein [Anabaena sp. UHCC 0399]